MALFDKIKTQVAAVGQMAQEAGKAGQAKVGEVQAKRKLDSLYRDLGEAAYQSETGTADADTPATVSRLIQEITQHIESFGASAAASEDDLAPGPGSGTEGSESSTPTTSTMPPATNAAPPTANYGSGGGAL